MPGPNSLLVLVEDYLADCLSLGQTERTVAAKRTNLKLFMQWSFSCGITQIDQLTLKVTKAYRLSLNDYRKKGTDLPIDVSTKRNRMTALKVFLAYLYQEELIQDDIASGVQLPKVPRRLPKGYLSVTEVTAIFKLTEYRGSRGLRDRAIFETFYATGIRRMELARLELSDIDFDKRLLTVNNGKGGKDRRVPISRRACDIIELYIVQYRAQHCRLESGKSLFLNNAHKPFTERQLSSLVSEYAKRAGITKPGACNLFRHSAATTMHENGADIRHIQEFLGHADISTTQIYTKVALNKLRAVYDETHPSAL
ncbi:tyrosine-type recombinase/integrase [Kangiella sp. TOML190]|uniref:tyrosine-type recombinase/integrase n=1 Tax=Kangiella sp. TOML190 TaxID=2931351 RepID=UPI00203F07AB|nr:tyrosine-type recombinase/integrase [Kangiella sp. TOML190]